MAGFLSLFNQTERITVAPGYWIDVKTSLNVEDYEAAQRTLLGKTMVGGSGEASSELDTVSYQHELVTRSIVEWNLTDEDDQPLPLAPESVKNDSVRRLPQQVFLDIYMRVEEAATPRTSTQEVSFRDGDKSGAIGGGSAQPDNAEVSG